ncbi:MAG: MFS transporter [Thermoplasmatales archaeon]|nr:MFS transporter [Thermoplasmatales archaeon]
MKDKNIVLIITCFSSFLVPFTSSSINIALPSIGRDFGVDSIFLGWITTSYILATAVLLLPFGKIGDIYGRIKIFLYGIIIFAVASFLSMISFLPYLFLILRIIHAIGSAMIFSNGIAILSSFFREERGKALGINASFTYAGLSSGPFIGGFLTSYFGWRSIFLLMIFICILIIFFLSRFKYEFSGNYEKFDYFGSFLSGASIISIICALSIIDSIRGIIIAIFSFLLFIFFIFWESKMKNPLINPSIFGKNIVFVFSNLTALIHYTATASLTFFMSLYLQNIKNYSASFAGLVLVSQPIFQAIFSPTAGKLSDRIDAKIIASLGIGLTALGIFLLALYIRNDPGLIIIVVILSLIGFGFAFFSSPNTNAIMASVEGKEYGIASATLATMRTIGQSASMGIAILLTKNYSFVDAMEKAFIISAILCIIGIFTSIARGRNNYK